MKGSQVTKLQTFTTINTIYLHGTCTGDCQSRTGGLEWNHGHCLNMSEIKQIHDDQNILTQLEIKSANPRVVYLLFSVGMVNLQPAKNYNTEETISKEVYVFKQKCSFPSQLLAKNFLDNYFAFLLRFSFISGTSCHTDSSQLGKL